MIKEKNLPNGWAIKPMTEVVTWGAGGTPKATESQYYDNGDIPWLIIGDLNDGVVTESQSKITELGLKNSSAKIIPAGTLLVAMYGSIGKLGITGIECCTNQAIAFAKELRGVSTKYMFYYMAMMKSKLISMGKGGTQNNISQTILKSLNVIVPPPEVQDNLVFRIEELFSELDKAVETLQTTKQQLAVYRQAVLKEAFEGKLTNSTISGKRRLGEYIEKPRYGTSKKCGYDTGKEYTAVIRIPNINAKQGIIDHSDLKYAKFDVDELKLLSLEEGDILIIRSNGSVSIVGMAAMVRSCDINDTFAGYLIRLRIHSKKELLPKYLLHFLSSYEARSYIERIAKSTSGVNNINAQEIARLEIPVTSMQEQIAIVTEIESRLSVCESIEQPVDTALAQADAMRQSILKQAFEGGFNQ